VFGDTSTHYAPGSPMSAEDEFHAALRKKSPMKAVRGAVPILLAGVAGAVALAAVWFLWPLDRIPIVVLGGVPLAAGVGAFVGAQKLLGD